MATEDTTDREIVISRLFAAPREVVFDAWMQPEALAAWWGPNGWSITTESIDIRTGGHWSYVMHGPNDLHFANYSEFTEVTPPERLAYRHGAASTATANDFYVTVTFEELAGKTFLTMKSIFVTAEAREMVVREHGAIEGGKQHLQKLADYLAGAGR
jgi:uncharacterized protein YndB with AHSA1/START domain